MFLTGGFRLLAPTIAAPLAAAGNWLAIPLFLLIFNIPHFLSRYFGIHLGYQWGSGFFDKIMASGLLKKVTEICYILGLTMIGAVSAGYVASVSYTHLDVYKRQALMYESVVLLQKLVNRRFGG